MLTESNAYFTVPHDFAVYLENWSGSQGIPSEQDLRSMQSVGLKLLSEVKELEASCLLQLRSIDNDAKAVVDFLKLQSRKVDLVLHHVLEKEVQTGEKFQGSHFGGSGISLITPKPLTIGEYFKTSIYISSELVAILCLCQVSQCKLINFDDDAEQNNKRNQPQYAVSLDFSQILDADVEQLVKASLTVQQKMLQQRKQIRQQAAK
ncbi:hypothetical protein BCU94_19145 [Shewanella sp. 10N.286.52.C2]|uniref:hypothetical protein n=1 Tax=Shewanella sp. 10N.286.52.C2 TaxID=1880838 RepID=UPI000C846ADB|nr:hypothetical protein [Shewanella sp. 10N.286.52.C2]PMG27116.1 hypothetical protein BCU94_19145 [Shewanella sp. 10N.286.52.C2]